MSTRMPVGPALEEAITLLREAAKHLPHIDGTDDYGCPACGTAHRIHVFLAKAANVRKRGSPGKRSRAKPVDAS